ncbi:LLM class flavin-dependent oxidoreductase [Brevibacterium atlanticum]|uniref:LLM class flavin-dependent oxidoreductase n=1 Tax=Brevibacterium atlanticum TaxID=2697563 RepID=UPI0014238DA6|nr:LLM class flavin-dependent oxidoreductase [Brevibacterium atlanticum]
MTEPKYLWYIPNQARPGHRGDEVRADHNSLDTLTEHARAVEANGWEGALLGTGWTRPDTFTVGTALAARTETFQPLIAARPGYWHPANFAAATATLDHLSRGRALINIVSGTDSASAYGDTVIERSERYARTQEFIHLVRRLWTEDAVTYDGRFYTLNDATLGARPFAVGERTQPTLYFGGASAEAERVAAAEADVQLFWGETYAAVAERIARLRALSAEVGRAHAPLEFGLRVTVVVRETSDEAWSVARARVAGMHDENQAKVWRENHRQSVGQDRLVALADEGDVLDDVLYTAPGRLGGQGAGTTWLVGSFAEVAAALDRYRSLGVSHFILSDTPYLTEVERVGQNLLPLLERDGAGATVTEGDRIERVESERVGAGLG